MSYDLKSRQLRVNKIINSGSVNSPLLIYGTGSAVDEQGDINASHFVGTGSDVWMFISGTRGSADSAGSYGTVAFKGDVVVSGALQLGESIAPGTPASGKGVLYVKASDSLIYFKNDAGSEYNLTSVTPGGSNKQIQFNDGGTALGGDAQFTYDKTSDFLSLTGSFSQGGSAGNGPKATGNYSHAEGRETVASGDYSHAEGYQSNATGNYSHAEGFQTTGSGNFSHAEGQLTTASNLYSHTEGISTTASGQAAHAEGFTSTASGNYSHAEGQNSVASGESSHAEGDGSTSAGFGSHAEGSSTVASGSSSHAEGFQTIASGNFSHAEGTGTTAVGVGSHAEGNNTTTYGIYSHAAGFQTIASGSFSYAGGNGTITSGSFQHVVGKFNKRSNDFSLFVIGDGVADADGTRGDIVRVNSGSIVGTGRVEVTGAVAATLGFTGSLTKLTNGNDYLIAGSNITLVTGSNGSVTISSTGGGSVAGSNTQVQFNDNGAFGAKNTFTFSTGSDRLSVTHLSASTVTASYISPASPLVIRPQNNPAEAGSDTFFYVTGSEAFDMAVFGGRLVTSGSIRVKNSSASDVVIINTAGAISGSANLQAGGSLTVAGDGAINGSNLTTTNTGIFNIINSNATTVNLAGAATSVNIGNGAGTVTIPGNLTVNGTTTTLNTQNLLVKDPVILLASGSAGFNANGGIAIFSGSADGSRGQDLVFGRVGADTWGAGTFSTNNGNVTTLAAMDLANIRALEFQVSGSQDALKIDGGTSLLLSSSTSRGVTLQHGAGVNGRVTFKEHSVEYFNFSRDSSPTPNRSVIQAGGTNDLLLTGSTIYLKGGVPGAASLVEMHSTLGAFLQFNSASNQSIITTSPLNSLKVQSQNSIILTGSDIDLNIGSVSNSLRFTSVGTSIVKITSSSIGTFGNVGKIESESGNTLALSGSNALLLGASSFGGAAGFIALVGQHAGRNGIFPGDDSSNQQFDLGAVNRRWSNIYTGDLHLKNERGDYTIIEEEDFLSIRFNKTGKRYKFMLEPVPELDE